MLIGTIAFLFVIAAAVLIESEREKKILSINRVSLRSGKVTKDRKLVFISDLHDKCFGENNVNLIEMVRNEKPDYILIGGDVIVTKKKKTNLRVLDQLLEECIKIAPVIYANGNHEQRLFEPVFKNTYGKWESEFLAIIRKHKVIYLSDSEYKDDEMTFYGLNLDRECYSDLTYRKIDTGYIKDHIGEPDRKNYNILLAHSPMFLDIYENWGADLGLCGHCHGGVMRIGERGVLSSQWIPFHKWCTGNIRIRNSFFVVSRGLGGHTIDVRLNNFPELSVIELKSDTKKESLS